MAKVKAGIVGRGPRSNFGAKASGVKAGRKGSTDKQSAQRRAAAASGSLEGVARRNATVIPD